MATSGTFNRGSEKKLSTCYKEGCGRPAIEDEFYCIDCLAKKTSKYEDF